MGMFSSRGWFSGRVAVLVVACFVVQCVAAQVGAGKPGVVATLWKWTPPAKCAVVKDQPVWIEAASISRDFPR